ncbi:MAG TPA: hypothetical protein VFI02_13910 [Armatimonadota bacterium]|nr:hypothetical protein [Armatimonadota bacterium]
MKICLLLLVLGSFALADCNTPIRPGIPAERQFWNRYSTQFIYAPAFDFDAWRTAQVDKYRFTAHSQANDKDYAFEADQPYAPLSPIWKDIPVGQVTLNVVALDEGGKELGEVGTRNFFRMPVFAGPYGKPDRSYEESAKWALQFQFNQAHYQGWKEGKRVEHRLNCYPNKIMSAVLFGMPRYAKLADKPSDRKDALAIATNCARHMMSISFPAGSPMEYWPPTYDPDSQTAKERMTWIAGERGQNVMTVFPADAGLAYLDLYDATGEKDFLEAAKRIAGTYGKLQLPNGTWPLLISVKTGQVTSDTLTIPSQAILLMDRLESQYGVTDYKDALRRAVDWVFKNPMENYFWQGQFEDIRPSSAYINLSHKAALAFAIYLFNHEKEHPEYTAMAEELLRFSEDQFVVWEPCGEKEERITPCALEQYRCYGPIVSTMARFIIAWTVAYNHTGKDEYLAKAQSLANSIVAFQAKNGGQYRTWLFTTDRKKNNNWDNAATEAAMAMLALNDAVTKKQNKQ